MVLLTARDEKQGKKYQNEIQLVAREAREFGVKYSVYGQCTVTT